MTRVWNTEVFIGGWYGSWLFGMLERNGLTCEWSLHRMERGEQGSFVRKHKRPAMESRRFSGCGRAEPRKCSGAGRDDAGRRSGAGYIEDVFPEFH